MACMELLYLTKESRQAALGAGGSWSLCPPPREPQQQQRDGGDLNAGAAAAGATLCCEKQDKSSPRAAAAEPTPASLPSPPGASSREYSAAPSSSQPCYQPNRLTGEEEAGKKKACCCSQELETSFTYVDENVNLEHARSPPSPLSGGCQDPLPQQGSCRERPPAWGHDSPSLVSEEDDATSEAASGKSVDYGFISAILFLVSGILLVIISYVVPRDVTVDPNTVAAREMERLENESARIGAHLDRCVIAGLCLLTLGGVVLSSLLMMSMWKGELYRRSRFTSSKESAKLYGSFNFRMKPGANDNMLELSLVEEDVLAIDN
nr:PREDICTED: transmembrane protein 74 [Struthio camelus australis]